MSEDPSSSQTTSSRQQEKSWLDKVLNAFSAEPKSREELLEIIREAADNKVVNPDELEIIQGALDVADQQVREIQVPRSQMVCINIDDQPADLLPTVIESGHSRFPVVGESTDDIRGILLAKDLLSLILNGTDNFVLENIIRPATIIPESKRLNVLLREFRENRYHMALVIDEYGGISGLVTIEDILEEIVGEIEDETDDDADDAFIRKVADNDYIVKALTPIEDFNEFFGSGFDEDEFDTIGGILMRAFGHLPQRNEVADIDGYQFRVLYADNRQIHLLRLTSPS
ncbi:CBS domain-containing protein [Pseudomaricurvus alkylphenolicus]|jgi:magnesium and cobalt transporter|uniref:HlyC/CorC family transporter n=1 Tax=Pseudomaricurvus alkylphenolicus TaxID=1306991 RepID=UPI00141EF787|nr:transporter associated domain-containing protein [Pseudomaricurvus alkylphenolicus]NIB40109.1 CBS domain-containing protein [Pseudomaricurvus alkylphenolicus]